MKGLETKTTHEMSARRRPRVFPIFVVVLAVVVFISVVSELVTVSKQFGTILFLAKDTIQSSREETNNSSMGNISLLLPEHPPKFVHKPKRTIPSLSSSYPGSIRWTAEQFQNFLMQELNHTSTQQAKTTQELLQLVPKPIGDEVEVYNREAWHRLRALLWDLPVEQDTTTTTHDTAGSRSSKVVLCSMGGSVTAGAANIPLALRWDRQFVEMFHTTQQQHQQVPRNSTSLRNIQVVNRGHGDRGSVHSALLYHSFVPPDTDVIVWEFSVNDSKNIGNRTGTANNALITFLNQVAQTSFSNDKAPPLVVLLYVWDRWAFAVRLPQQWQRIPASIFNVHNALAAEYDFVVGAVNLASYVDNLLEGWTTKMIRDALLTDIQHPNIRGHWMMAYLLWDLVMDDLRNERMTSFPNSQAKSTSLQERNQPVLPFLPEYECPLEPRAQQRVYKMLQNRSAIASWTAEAPVNDNGTHGMLNPRYYRVPDAGTDSQSSPSLDKNLTIVLHGKTAPMRTDRKLSLVLPCCESGDRVSFDLSSLSSLTGPKTSTPTTGRDESASDGISAIAVTLLLDGKEKDNLWTHLQVDWRDENATRPMDWATAANSTRPEGTATAVGPEWTVLSPKRCPMVDGNLFTTWIVLPPPDTSPLSFWNLTRMYLCSLYPRCQDPQAQKMELLSLVLL